MSSSEITHIRSFYTKAEELQEKGHLLRAAEKYGAAADAARALDPGPDNVVAADLQLCQAAVLINYIAVAIDAGAELASTAGLRADCVALVSAAVAVLERRRVAGTLLEGKCTAAEEAWYAADLNSCGIGSAEVAAMSKLVGYNAFLHGAFYVLGVFISANWYAEMCSAAQFSLFSQHVVLALEMMQLPRSSWGRMALGAETCIVDRLFSHCAIMEQRGLPKSLVLLILTAWARLRNSGVLESRGILNAVSSSRTTASLRAHTAAVQAAMEAPNLRTCALAACGAKEAHPAHYKRCAACGGVVYCSREHQVADWPAHKAACKAARKNAAAESAQPSSA